MLLGFVRISLQGLPQILEAESDSVATGESTGMIKTGEIGFSMARCISCVFVFRKAASDPDSSVLSLVKMACV